MPGAAPEGASLQRVSPEVAAEAAVWVARLHGPSRSAQMEREFLAWQALSAAHREAFEKCTETWQDVPRVSVASAFASTALDRPARVSPFARWAAPVLGLGVIVVVCVAAYQSMRHDLTYATAVGEQKSVLLDDGTRMTLNTDTRASVSIGERQRRISLDHGEAMFQVAKDAQRPFVVRAGGSEVVALGTTFTVRYTPEVRGDPGLEVTLVEGTVSVQADGQGTDGAVAPRAARRIEPGDRLRVSRAAGGGSGIEERIDRPRLEAVTAWERNEAVFEDVSLLDAVAEMNRYSRTAVVLVEPDTMASVRISGLFRTGDIAGFARAVASLHGLVLNERDGRLELARPQAGNR